MKIENVDFNDDKILLAKESLAKGHQVLLKIEGHNGDKLNVSVIQISRKLLTLDSKKTA